MCRIEAPKMLDRYQPVPLKPDIMSKVDKKKAKLTEEINRLEADMRKQLTQKTSNTKEISVGEYQIKIAKLKKELLSLQ